MPSISVAPTRPDTTLDGARVGGLAYRAVSLRGLGLIGRHDVYVQESISAEQALGPSWHEHLVGPAEIPAAVEPGVEPFQQFCIGPLRLLRTEPGSDAEANEVLVPLPGRHFQVGHFQVGHFQPLFGRLS